MIQSKDHTHYCILSRKTLRTLSYFNGTIMREVVIQADAAQSVIDSAFVAIREDCLKETGEAWPTPVPTRSGQ